MRKDAKGDTQKKKKRITCHPLLSSSIVAATVTFYGHFNKTGKESLTVGPVYALWS